MLRAHFRKTQAPPASSGPMTPNNCFSAVETRGKAAFSPSHHQTLLPGAGLCRSIPRSEIKTKMSSTETRQEQRQQRRNAERH